MIYYHDSSSKLRGWQPLLEVSEHNNNNNNARYTKKGIARHNARLEVLIAFSFSTGFTILYHGEKIIVTPAIRINCGKNYCYEFD